MTNNFINCVTFPRGLVKDIISASFVKASFLRLRRSHIRATEYRSNGKAEPLKQASYTPTISTKYRTAEKAEP